MNRPSLADTVARYGVDLRRSGRELRAHCPFHDNQSFAFSVNEEKGMFYCFGCGAGGDVIRFIELMEKCSFKEACKILQIENHRPQPRPYKTEAANIAAWARATSILVRDALRTISDQVRVCSLARKQAGTDRDLLVQHQAGLARAWAILCDFDEDLNDPKVAVELYSQRDDIERLVETAT